jgi:hypothetical protein
VSVSYNTTLAPPLGAGSHSITALSKSERARGGGSTTINETGVPYGSAHVAEEVGQALEYAMTRGKEQSGRTGTTHSRQIGANGWLDGVKHIDGTGTTTSGSGRAPIGMAHARTQQRVIQRSSERAGGMVAVGGSSGKSDGSSMRSGWWAKVGVRGEGWASRMLPLLSRRHNAPSLRAVCLR